MHLRRHARGIGIPVQQVEGERIVAHQIVVDHEGPDQVIRAQHVEGAGHLAAFKIAALVHLVFQCVQLLLVDEHTQFAGFGEIHHGDEEGCGLDPVIPLHRHVRQGGGQQRAAQAIADGIDLAFAGGLLDRVQRRQVAFLHVRVEPLLGQFLVGIDPGDHEHGMALRHRPTHETVPRPQVQDVELVDPGRPDQQRPLQHLLGRGGVLDQLHQFILKHHLAGGDPDIAANLEGVGVGHLDVQAALAAFQVAQQVVQALQQVFPAGLGRLAQHLRVGQQEVAGTHRVDELARIEIHLLCGFRVQPVHVRDDILHEAGRQQIGLLDEVEDLAFLPGVILEAAVGGGGVDHRGVVHAHHPARGILPQGHIVLPESQLGLHQAGGIGHQAGRHLHEGRPDVQRIGGPFLRPLALQPLADQALGPFGDIGHGPPDGRRVRQLEGGGVGLGRRLLRLGHGDILCVATTTGYTGRRQRGAGPTYGDQGKRRAT